MTSSNFGTVLDPSSYCQTFTKSLIPSQNVVILLIACALQEGDIKCLTV